MGIVKSLAVVGAITSAVAVGASVASSPSTGIHGGFVDPVDARTTERTVGGIDLGSLVTAEDFDLRESEPNWLDANLARKGLATCFKIVFALAPVALSTNRF